MHQHVEFVHDFTGRFDVAAVGEVQRERGGPEPPGDRVEPVRLPAGQQQGVRGSQRRGDRRTDTAPGAGDECIGHAVESTDPASPVEKG
ncbi:hypothetical protein MOKP44_34000 [Mycobacterium avium subsp. hominissuis]